MSQQRTLGLSLLLLAIVSAVIAAMGAYNFARGEGEGLDAAFTLSAVLATGACGGWAFHFLRDQSPATQPPSPPAP